jgi:hypothetical protein
MVSKLLLHNVCLALPFALPLPHQELAHSGAADAIQSTVGLKAIELMSCLNIFSEWMRLTSGNACSKKRLG